MPSISHHQRNQSKTVLGVTSHRQILGITSHLSEWLLSGRKNVLERMWRKGNKSTLLVRMQLSTAIMKNSMKFLPKLKSRTITWSSNPTAGCHMK
jgi:hypothetical protein